MNIVPVVEVVVTVLVVVPVVEGSDLPDNRPFRNSFLRPCRNIGWSFDKYFPD
jgi:hypothetical protein